MVAVLLIAGIVLLSAGLVAIGFGIPVKEFSFGNTLIFSGTIVACTGLMMLALWMVVRELKAIARQFGVVPASEVGGRFDRDQPEPENAGKEPAARSFGSLPWKDETAPRDRERQNAPATPEIAEAAQTSKQRRNLMFSSSPRKERERAQGRTSELSATDLRSAPPDMAAGPADPPQPSFEDAWPKSERSRAPEPPRRSGRPPRFGAGAAPAIERNEDRPAVTVLKSGIVDGMAYSLFSDGSIEAQMPEGMMRFASIDELRSHLDQRA
jgi:hypothetical protein